MTKTKTPKAPAAPAVQLPLFYRQPEPLSADRHGALRILPGDFAFAATTNATPLMVQEFAHASRDMPIVFAGETADPVAVLGLERDNLFVTDGHWVEDAYVPAYVRRYPFVFFEGEGEAFALGLDMAADRVAQDGEAGEPLFEDGEPAPLTRTALAFCGEMLSAQRTSRALVEGLKAYDLLIPQRADIRLPGGRPADHRPAAPGQARRRGGRRLAPQGLAGAGPFPPVVARPLRGAARHAGPP